MSGVERTSKFVSETPEQTRSIARQVARSLRPGDVLYLYGELGSGKTVFVQGLCAGLDVKDDVTSPSFVIATEYEGRYRVTHVDLYRLDGKAAGALPIEEYMLDKGITVIEWADRLDRAGTGIVVRISIVDHQKRLIEIEDIRD